MALIYLVVFTVIFQARRGGHQPYFLHLVTGLFLWQWFAQNMTETSRALLSEARLVRSANLPRELWVVRVVLAKGVEFVLTLPVIVAFTISLHDHRRRRSCTRRSSCIALLLVLLLSVGIEMILTPSRSSSPTWRASCASPCAWVYADAGVYSADMAPTPCAPCSPSTR